MNYPFKSEDRVIRINRNLALPSENVTVEFLVTGVAPVFKHKLVITDKADPGRVLSVDIDVKIPPSVFG
jgi:hypothetical protein